MVPECCLFINVQFNGVWYHLPVEPNPMGGDYNFTIVYDTGEGTAEVNVALEYSLNGWSMINLDTEQFLYSIDTDGCPYGSMSEWNYNHEGEPFFNDFEILNVSCEQTVPECCLSLSGIYDGETYTVDVVPFYDEGDNLLYYTIQFGYINGDLYLEANFNLYYYDGIWYIVDADTAILYYSLDLAGCPGSVNTEWQQYTEFFDAFVIFSLDCENEPDEEEFIDIPEKPDLYYCKHKNLMRKVRAGLADRVADMKDVERFGLDKCMDKWEHIIKDYLIVHALQCAPYNEYTGLDEKCLIGKLTDKFNC